MSYNQYMICQQYAERAVAQRRAAESANCERGNTIVAAMLVEGKLMNDALEHLNLTYVERLDYVEKNSVMIKAKDGHEAIQIVWVKDSAICIHRILSKEFRNEFNAHWLGVWSESIELRDQKSLVRSFEAKISLRNLMRQYVGANNEIQFAASPAALVPTCELRF